AIVFLLSAPLFDADTTLQLLCADADSTVLSPKRRQPSSPYSSSLRWRRSRCLSPVSLLLFQRALLSSVVDLSSRY
ncbi:hypothetical protein PIB30_054755, partial [Stylosanthes scabra]|nr:hypothetical protein [Stylosanthes scabra]